MSGGMWRARDLTARQAVILVIDDDPTNLAVMAGCLGDSSYTVLVAEDCESGVQRAVYARPDLILLDVMMPGTDGYDTCRALKAHELTRDIPVIFMTALADTDHKVRGFREGAVDYITKPFQREEVLARVGVHLRLRELADGLRRANDELERRVDERTQELARANEGLQAEIAERRLAEKAVAQSRKFLDQVINSVADPILVKDQAHRWVLLNDACCHLIGRPREELLGRSANEFFPRAEAEEFCEKDNLVLRTGTENVNEERVTDSTGQVRTVVTKKTLYVDEAGERFVVGVIRDITERKSLEEQLRQAQKMEAVGNLAGGIAHDFNNMLTAITGYADLMRHHTGCDGPLRRYADGVASAADRAASLTHSLLAFSRKRICERQPVDLNQVVARMKSFLERVLGETVEIETRLAPCDLVVLADCGHLEQLLVNTATNARDAMPGGGTLTIRTTRVADSCHDPAYAVLSIEDTGTGMDEETRKRIFEPFFTTKEEGKGTGLGLAIVQAIVNQHEGQIEVRSEPGKGTTVAITLGLVKPAALGVEPEGLQTARGGVETILVGEDDRDVRVFIKTLLEEFGYNVLVAERGDDVLRLYEERGQEVDLLLLDEVLPGKNGTTIVEDILRTRGVRPLPALLFSGYTGEDLVTAEMKSRGVEFMRKPLTMQALLTRVRELLDESAADGGPGAQAPTECYSG